MKSVFELECSVVWARQRLLDEADRERLLRQVPRPSRHLRARAAIALYWVARWLSPEVVQPAPRLAMAVTLSQPESNLEPT